MAVKKKKPVKPQEPNMVPITVNNIFSYLVNSLENAQRKLDRLQMTIDAVGLAVVERKKNG